MKSFFFTWLRSRRAAILAWVLFVVIFALVFALYRLPAPALLYPAAVCAVLGLGFLYASWRRAKEKHRELSALAETLPATLAELLPPPETAEDEDYGRLLRLTAEREQALRVEDARRYRDTVDYYTLWAHQIKTPIASMRLTLQNEDSPAAQRLTAELFRIEQYVEMVLVYLRLDSTSTDYVIAERELEPIVRGAVKRFSAEFISRKLSLDYQPPAGRVLTDEKWLSFVIEQLLSNALKYTPSGAIRVWAEPGPVLYIRDTGIGIDPADLPRVFDKGYTGYNGREDKRASGLGLWLCKQICERLGHALSIASAPGEGTTAKLDLRRREFRPE